MNRVLFRVNSSSDIGLGHLMRCLTLAKEYKTDRVYFACENLNGNLNQKVLDNGYELKVLEDPQASTLIKLIKKLKIDFLVIDHYEINASFEKKIKDKTNVTILSFDDIYKKHHCDILLNHNVYAKKKDYENLVPSSCEIRCGKKYTLIRDEFKKTQIRRKTKAIFISIGGTDHLGINIDILKSLRKIYPKYQLHMVTSSANKRIKKLQKYCSGKKHICLHIDSKKMAKLMSQSNFAIVTPSVVVHEVLYMKLDFLAIKTADNQKFMYKYLKNKKYKVLKSFSKMKLEKTLQRMK